MPNALSLSLVWPRLTGRRVDSAADRDATSDEALFGRVCRSDDHAAFGELVTRYRSRVTALARRMLAPTQTAIDPQDVAQEAFVEAYHRRATFRQGAPVRPWLYGIAVNRCLDQLRALEREAAATVDPLPSDDETVAAAGSGGDPLVALIRQERAGEMEYAIAHLPAKLRAVLILRYLDDMTYEEIGEACGLPIGTVKTHLFRARAELKRRLESNEAE